MYQKTKLRFVLKLSRYSPLPQSLIQLSSLIFKYRWSKVTHCRTQPSVESTRLCWDHAPVLRSCACVEITRLCWDHAPVLRSRACVEITRLCSSYTALQRERDELEADGVEFRRQVAQTGRGGAAKEIRALKDVIRSLEEDVVTERTKQQRAAARRAQQCRQLADEVRRARLGGNTRWTLAEMCTRAMPFAWRNVIWCRR